MINAHDALARLREGNGRFVAAPEHAALPPTTAQRRALAQTQQPIAAILGCSDSRVPAELVFGQGLGDLFVIRVAGNVAAPTQIGSVEFAAAKLGVRLVVVLGHTGCGAIAATLEALRKPDPDLSSGLRSLVERITPAVAPLLDASPASDDAALAPAAVRANVRAAVEQLRHDSTVLADLIRGGGLRVVGAVYDLTSGAVEFLDRIP
jgi:carbonic anhydrase